jgi:hypothetical protein
MKLATYPLCLLRPLHSILLLLLLLLHVKG